MYIVKSKTGKEYPFEELNTAEEFAKNKSTKTVCYCIYEGDRSIGAYRNKIRLPDWKTVYAEKYPKSYTKEEFYEEIKIAQEEDPQVYAESREQLVGLFIDTFEDKVRYRWVYNKLVRLRNDVHLSKLRTKSVVFHPDGKTYYCENGKIQFGIQPTDFLVTANNGAMKRLATELGRLRPEIADMLKQYYLKYPIQVLFSKPTYKLCYDEYRKEFKPRENFGLDFSYFPHELIDESKLPDWICNKYKIPNTKGLHKLYCQQLKNIQIVQGIKQCKFKDVNSIYKLAGFMRIANDPKWFKPFCLKLIKVRGENRAVEMLYDAERGTVDDCVRLINYVSQETADYIIKNARNIEEIHDSLVSVADYEKPNNVQIKYRLKEESYNRKYDNVVFQLAKDTKELAVIGAEMGICVGSYAEDAVSKRKTIVKMLDGEKYIACIEVRNNHLAQLKAKFNNPVKIEYKQYIDKWLKDTGIKANDCRDYKEIGEPWKLTFNHARIRPEQFVENEKLKLQIVRAVHKPCKHLSTWYRKEEDKNYQTYGIIQTAFHTAKIPERSDFERTKYAPLNRDIVAFTTLSRFALKKMQAKLDRDDFPF